jgi:hypothetical protein
MSRTLYTEVDVDEESVPQATMTATETATTTQTATAPTVVCIENDDKAHTLTVLTAAEERFLKNVKRVAKHHDKTVSILGRIVDRLIAEKGGIKYGEETFERMKDYPDLPFTPEYLRQCWHVHRTIVELSDELQTVAPNITASHMRVLARFHRVENEAERRTLILDAAKAVATSTPRMNVPRLGNLVTERLDRYERHLRDMQRAPKHQTTPKPSRRSTAIDGVADQIQAERSRLQFSPEAVDIPATIRQSRLALDAIVELLDQVVAKCLDTDVADIANVLLNHVPKVTRLIERTRSAATAEAAQ